MKKLLTLCLMIVLSMSLLTSCNIKYKPISIKYQNSDYAPYPDGEHKIFLLDLINNSKWHNDVAKCECDYTILMKNDREIFYHSECGTFIDYDFNKSLTISEENRVKLNAYFVDSICRSEVHFFDENHICTACGYTKTIGGAFEFEYVATEEGHCEHKVGTTCDEICVKSPHENYDADLFCDICGYELSDIPQNDNISNHIDKIVDLTESGEIGTDDALECFFSDGSYSYYFPSIKSQYIIVYYKDGTQQNVKDALAEGKIKISGLDFFGIQYYIQPIE